MSDEKRPPETCPDCGDILITPPGYWTAWGLYGCERTWGRQAGWGDRTLKCLTRQLAQRDAEIVRLRGAMETIALSSIRPVPEMRATACLWCRSRWLDSEDETHRPNCPAQQARDALAEPDLGEPDIVCRRPRQ